MYLYFGTKIYTSAKLSGNIFNALTQIQIYYILTEIKYVYFCKRL
jgi:hypothetical protein